MNADRWQQVDRLLDEVLALPPNERSDYLTRASDGDEELRREVASLLRAHSRAEEKFLGSPALELAARGLAAQREVSIVGKRFGAYQVISVLGVGGMGEVYLAKDERLGRQLALKILPSHFVTDKARVERFAREARAVSALNHPNIVTVYDIGEIEGRHFIAMEHVAGHTLREKIQNSRHEPIGVIEVLEMALQISAALAAAHEAGIIHRDIKPENLMLRRDDYIKVLDFGLAKLTENRSRSLMSTLAEASDPAATNPGAILGTLKYMSPEQALGQEVDRRSDIFSFGVVLYELLTGSSPFKGDTPAAILDAVTHHTPLPLTQLRPDVSPELERLVNRMLEKDRELRYQTAAELRISLKQLKRELDSSPSHSLSTTRSEPNSVKFPAAIGMRTLMAGSVLLVLISLAAWWFWPQNKPEPSPWLSAFSTQLTDFPGEERNPSLSPNGNMVFYSRRVKGQSDIFWQRIGGSKPTNLTEDSDDDDTQPACSPDGKRIAFRSERQGGGLFVMGATGENVRQISNYGHNPAWSPDGTRIACGTDYILDPKRRSARSRLAIIDIATGKDRVLLDAFDVAQPRWSPNGKRIAYYNRSKDNRLDIWTVAEDGSDARPVTNDGAVDWNPVWSPDGQYLYFVSDRKALASLWRMRIDQETGIVSGEPEAVTSPTSEIVQLDVSADGRRIVYANRIQDANIKSIGFDPIGLNTIGEAVPVTQGTRTSGSPNLSPDGQWVTFHTLGSALEDVWLVRADGTGQQNNLTDDEALDRSPRWSPNGELLAYFSNRNKQSQIWVMNRDGSNKRQITFSDLPCSFPFWSPNGDRLAYQLSNSAGASGNVRGTQIIEFGKPWDQQTPTTLPMVNNETGEWFNGYSWSPDGKKLVGYTLRLQGKEIRRQFGVVVYSFETKRYERLTDIGDRLDWMADSRHVMFTHFGKGDLADKNLWAVNIETKVVKSVYSHPNWIVSTFGLTRDNRRLFFTATAHQADVYLLSLDK